MKCICRKDGQSDGKHKQQGEAAQLCVVSGIISAHQKGWLAAEKGGLAAARRAADTPSNGIARERGSLNEKYTGSQELNMNSNECPDVVEPQEDKQEHPVLKAVSYTHL